MPVFERPCMIVALRNAPHDRQNQQAADRQPET
jgi:hypothetical protein